MCALVFAHARKTWLPALNPREGERDRQSCPRTAGGTSRSSSSSEARNVFDVAATALSRLSNRRSSHQPSLKNLNLSTMLLFATRPPRGGLNKSILGNEQLPSSGLPRFVLNCFTSFPPVQSHTHCGLVSTSQELRRGSHWALS